jgi:hypothetical protein
MKLREHVSPNPKPGTLKITESEILPFCTKYFKGNKTKTIK